MLGRHRKQCLIKSQTHIMFDDYVLKFEFILTDFLKVLKLLKFLNSDSYKIHIYLDPYVVSYCNN